MKIFAALLLAMLMSGCATLFPPTPSAVYELRAGMSHEEAAQVLGCPVPTRLSNVTGQQEHTWRCRTDEGEVMLRFVNGRLHTVYS